MGWELGYDENWKRDVGYGVPAYCDHPGCHAEIDRGLAYVCGGDPFGGEHGCGLYFCDNHLFYSTRAGQLCERCAKGKPPFEPTADHPRWVKHKDTDPSWEQWRKEQRGAV